MDKILIVEDDEKLRAELEKFLKNNGYNISTISKFDNITEDILNKNADLVLLDINLPGADGEYLCKEIRKTSNVPIIMITCRDNELDELISLNNGADQYVTKPYNLQILLAKISGLLKRNQRTDMKQNKIDFKDFILDVTKSVIEANNKQVKIGKNEFKILHFLTLNRGKIVPREDIMEYLWDSEAFIDDNTLTVNIKRLRSKLEELNLQDLIETRRGQGYILK